MFKALRNELRLRMTLTTASPLLIRSGKSSGIDPVLPDMQVVRDASGRPYIPGSSLKGVVRSRVEQLLRSLDDRYACDPLGRGCGRYREVTGTEPGEPRYRAHCYACRLFGSTAIAGRIAFVDAFAPAGQEPRTAERHNVAIDRRSGGQSPGALFSPEVVEQGRFEAEVRLTNFALWQVLALIDTLRDLDEGYVTLGGGSSRGFGRVRVSLPEVQFDWRDLRREPPAHLKGYSERDAAPGPLPAAWQPAALGRQLSWQGIEPLVGPGGALAGVSVAQALQWDPPGAPAPMRGGAG